MDLIYLALDRDRWRVVVSTVMNILKLRKVGIFCSSHQLIASPEEPCARRQYLLPVMKVILYNPTMKVVCPPERLCAHTRLRVVTAQKDSVLILKRFVCPV